MVVQTAAVAFRVFLSLSFAALEPSSDREVGAIQLVGDLVDGHSGCTQPQDNDHFLTRERFDRHVPQVVNEMVASIHDLKVLWIVVQRIAVNMVDDLFRPKSATERILRDEAMFGHPPTTDRQVAVTLVDPAVAAPPL